MMTPAWRVDRLWLAAPRPDGGDRFIQFDVIARQLLDGVELTFKGLALRRSR
jgi:hypothetical protein